MARLRWVSSPYQVLRRPGWMSVAGRCFAISRAVATMSFASRPVSFAAHCGVLGASALANASNPSPCSATNFLSYKPSETITFIHASSSARSVPGRSGSQYFALLAAVEKRGSATMIVAPLRIASANSCTCVLCMFSPMCEPSSTRQRVCAMSSVSGEPGVSPTVSV